MVPYSIKYMELNIDMKRRKLFFAVVGPGSNQFQRWENFNDIKKLFRAIYESTKQGTSTSIRMEQTIFILAYLGGASFFASCILKGNGEEILLSYLIPLLLTIEKINFF